MESAEIPDEEEEDETVSAEMEIAGETETPAEPAIAEEKPAVAEEQPAETKTEESTEATAN